MKITKHYISATSKKSKRVGKIATPTTAYGRNGLKISRGKR
jgi:hypothetical protein